MHNNIFPKRTEDGIELKEGDKVYHTIDRPSPHGKILTRIGIVFDRFDKHPTDVIVDFVKYRWNNDKVEDNAEPYQRQIEACDLKLWKEYEHL